MVTLAALGGAFVVALASVVGVWWDSLRYGGAGTAVVADKVLS